MSKKRFESCYKCTPPKRKPGCHATCKEYIDEKAAYEVDKKKIDEAKAREAFLDDMERRRDNRIKKVQRR